MIREISKFIKYSIVGVSGTILDIVFIFIFVEFLSLSIITAATFSFIIAATNNFILNKVWTFNNKSREYRHQYLKFLTVSIVGLTITIFLMYVFSTLLGIWYILAKLITSGIVLAWNFLGNRLWTFKAERPDIKQINEYKYEYSIVIPSYNEEIRLPKTLKKIKEYLDTKNLDYEIIVVNDGSIDETVGVINKMKKEINNLTLIDLDKNYGKGFAVRSGVENSYGKHILITDADNATPIEELSKFESYIDKNDLIIGSRKMSGSNILVNKSILRRIISSTGNKLISTLVKDIKDTQCGFKLIKNNVARHLFSKQKTYKYGFDIELLSLAQYHNYKIIEVPVTWIHDKRSKVSPIKDSVKTFKEFVGIHYNFLTKRY